MGMHHANVDRIWHMWQSMHPSKAMDYSGHSPVTRRNSRLSDTIDIGYGSKYAKTITVRELMQVSALGYTYSTGVTPVRGPPPPPPQSQRGNRFTRWRNNAWSTVRRLFSTRQTPRKHKVMIKYLEPLPATWVKANNLDAAKLERRRRKVNRFTKWLNSLKNFFPRVIDSTVSFFRSRTRREYESREKALVETVKIYKEEKRGLLNKLHPEEDPQTLNVTVQEEEEEPAQEEQAQEEQHQEDHNQDLADTTEMK